MSELCFTQVRRLVTGQYILDGKVVRKLRLVGAVYLVDWLDVGPVVGMLESSSQDHISNTGKNGDRILNECHFAENKTKSILFLHNPFFLPGHVHALG